MARRVFFSFHFKHDVWRAWQVRNANRFLGYEYAGFFDEGEKDDLRSKGQEAIARAIRARLDRSTVTTVLIGTYTHTRDWVRWEIEESLLRGNGMLGVYIYDLVDPKQPASGPPTMRFSLPVPFPCLRWNAADTEPFRKAVDAAGQRAERTTQRERDVAYLSGVNVVPSPPAGSIGSMLMGQFPPASRLAPPPRVPSPDRMTPPPQPSIGAFAKKASLQAQIEALLRWKK